MSTKRTLDEKSNCDEIPAWKAYKLRKMQESEYLYKLKVSQYAKTYYEKNREKHIAQVKKQKLYNQECERLRMILFN
jgi:hypothetical protein